MSLTILKSFLVSGVLIFVFFNSVILKTSLGIEFLQQLSFFIWQPKFCLNFGFLKLLSGSCFVYKLIGIKVKEKQENNHSLYSSIPVKSFQEWMELMGNESDPVLGISEGEYLLVLSDSTTEIFTLISHSMSLWT